MRKMIYAAAIKLCDLMCLKEIWLDDEDLAVGV